MGFRTIELTPRVGTQIETDIETLLNRSHAVQLRSLAESRGVLLIRGVAMDGGAPPHIFLQRDRARSDRGATRQVAPTRRQSSSVGLAPSLRTQIAAHQYFRLAGRRYGRR